MSTGEHPPTVVSFGEDILERMARAAQRVQERLERSTAALEQSAITYALGGSNATAAWIASVDEAAIRQARNVELVLRRSEFEAATRALLDLRDMIDVALVDRTWLDRLPPELATRLQELLDNRVG